MFEEIWDWIQNAFDYIISFEWFEDIRDFFSDMFENIGEFSFYGLIFGVVNVVFVLFTKQWLLDPFLKYMGATQSIVMTIVVFVAVFIVGYLLGKRFENTA